MTDALLFDWAELAQLGTEAEPTSSNVDFRYVTSQNGIKANSYSQYAIPKDIADITRDRDMNQLAEVLAVSSANESRRTNVSLPLESNENR